MWLAPGLSGRKECSIWEGVPASAKGLRWICAWADRCTGRQQANVGESIRKHRDTPCHHETYLPGRRALGKPWAGYYWTYNLLLERILALEFLPSFSKGGLGGVMEPLWVSLLCGIETSPVTATGDGGQPSSSTPVGKHLSPLIVQPSLTGLGEI